MGGRITRVTDVESVEVGKFYLAPHIQIPGSDGIMGYAPGEFCPVLTPMHEDGDLLNFPYMHYHYDRRFIPPEEYQKHLFYWDSLAVSVILESRVGTQSDRRVSDAWLNLPIHWFRRKCYRQMPEMQLPDESPIARRLIAAHADCELRDRVCPHKGVSLMGIPVNDRGQIVCPGHGLKWNAVTGKNEN